MVAERRAKILRRAYYANVPGGGKLDDKLCEEECQDLADLQGRCVSWNSRSSKSRKRRERQPLDRPHPAALLLAEVVLN